MQWLKVNGSTLQNENGDAIQLRGISSHGIAWFSDLITYDNLQYLKINAALTNEVLLSNRLHPYILSTTKKQNPMPP